MKTHRAAFGIAVGAIGVAACAQLLELDSVEFTGGGKSDAAMGDAARSDASMSDAAMSDAAMSDATMNDVVAFDVAAVESGAGDAGIDASLACTAIYPLSPDAGAVTVLVSDPGVKAFTVYQGALYWTNGSGLETCSLNGGACGPHTLVSSAVVSDAGGFRIDAMGTIYFLLDTVTDAGEPMLGKCTAASSCTPVTKIALATGDVFIAGLTSDALQIAGDIPFLAAHRREVSGDQGASYLYRLDSKAQAVIMDPAGEPGVTNSQALIVDPATETIYWVPYANTSNGPSPNPIDLVAPDASGVSPVVTKDPDINALALSTSGILYWGTNDGTINACLAASCSDAGSVANDQDAVESLAVSTQMGVSTVYWANGQAADAGTATALRSVRTSGIDTAVRTLACGTGTFTNVQVDATHIYWSHTGDATGGIKMMTLP